MEKGFGNARASPTGTLPLPGDFVPSRRQGGPADSQVPETPWQKVKTKGFVRFELLTSER
jgi:hypothetical protein